MNERLHIRTADGNRSPLQLGRVIHKGGGAGRICAVAGDPETVAKLYHDPERARDYAPKIAAMLERLPALPDIEEDGERYVQIAWPKAAIEDAGGRFIGFTMPFIDLSRAVSLDHLLVKALRRKEKLPENYAYRAFAAQNVAAAVSELHRLGHHIIDLKPQNLSIYRKTMYVAVLDCDGLSINGGDRRFPAHQFTDGYRAPESVAGGLAPQQLGEEQDRFALAVVLFQLLNQGIHPFQGVPRREGDRLGTEQERLNAGDYPYGQRENSRQAPSPLSLHRHLEDDTLALFERAFASRYRPSAQEWRNHLRGLIEDGAMQRCAANPQEHAHFSKGCGLCAVEEQRRSQLSGMRERAARNAARRETERPKRVATGTRGRWRRVPVRHFPARPAPRTITGPMLRQWALQLGQRMAVSLWRNAKAFLVGAGGTRVAMPSNPWARAASLLFYALFAVNLLALGLVAASFASPRSFTWLPKLLQDFGLHDGLERMRPRQQLKELQSLVMFAVAISSVVTGVLCYRLAGAAKGTVAATHAQWLTRTVWLTPMLAMVMTIAGQLVPAAYFLLFALPVWLAWRWGKGLALLIANRPLPAPAALI